MKINNKQINSSFIIFIIIAIWYVIGNFIWWQISTPILPERISAIHFLDVFLKNQYLFYNAPILTYIMRFMFFIFGKEHYDLIVIFVNYIFFLIPLYFIYKIGVELKDKETGNIAMILFALVPAVYGMSRQYGHQDYHIIAAITFNIYCLIKTDYFKNRKWTILYGISVGLGLMIKDSFLAYFFVPFLYIVIVGLKENIDKRKIINVLTAIVIGSLIAGWHYFSPVIITKIWHEPIIQQEQIFVFESLSIMTTGLWEELLSPPIFIIFFIGLIFFIRKYRGKYKNIILLWFIIPWTIIMFMPHYKLTEYGAGFIPVTVLLGAIFISSIEKNFIKKLIFALLILIGLVQYIDFSYGINKNLFNVCFKYNGHSIAYYNKYNPLISYNNKQTQQILKLAKFLKSNNSDSEFYVVDKNGFNFYSILLQLDLSDLSYKQGYYYYENILQSDTVVITGEPIISQEIIDFNINIMFSEETKDKILKDIECIPSEINKNYHIINMFYFDKTKDKNAKITLLGRKNKNL